MNDNIILYTQIISIVGTFIVSIASVLLTQYFYKKNQEKKEQKEKEQEEVKLKKYLYNKIKKYARSLPDISPRDILNRLDAYNKYPYMSAEETKKLILNKYNKAILNEEKNNSEICILKFLYEQLNDSMIKYDNASKIYEEIYINSSDDIDKYVNENIVDLFLDINDLSYSAFELGTTGYYDRSYFDNTKGNEFLEIYSKLLGAINDELEILDKQ